ncbi:hypothetical protein [Nakamurella sp.]|uniref:hypothetical protein n=1 Tax=Nakamurella sp. TaxID=1869182 RepID=UPI003B3ADE35
MARQITVELTSDEALVLFEWLHRSEDKDELQTPTAGERIALHAVSCALESVLVEPFADDYSELVRAAAARLTSVTGDDHRPRR